MRKDIYNLQKQVDELQQEVAAPRKEADLKADLQTIKEDLKSLRASVEDNQNLAAKTSARQDQLEKQIKELETRFGQGAPQASEITAAPPQPALPGSVAEKGAVPPVPSVEKTTPEQKTVAVPEPSKPKEVSAPPPVVSDVERAYNDAFQTLQAGDLNGARDKFLAFIKEHPRTTLSGNAQFWIGDIYFKKRQYEAAILAYEDVIKKYPDSNKVPDALLKQGLAFQELGDKIDAKIILENLIKKYPSTDQAKTAKSKLQNL
jgi:tol-pal system protein YbgF